MNNKKVPYMLGPRAVLQVIGTLSDRPRLLGVFGLECGAGADPGVGSWEVSAWVSVIE